MRKGWLWLTFQGHSPPLWGRHSDVGAVGHIACTARKRVTNTCSSSPSWAPSLLLHSCGFQPGNGTNRSATVLHQAFPRVCGADHWHYLSHPSGIFCGFIYISIMNNRAKHLFYAYESFVYLLWKKWLWRDFGQFKRSDLQRSCVWFWFLWWIHYVGQTDLKVTQSYLSLPRTGVTGMSLHTWLGLIYNRWCFNISLCKGLGLATTLTLAQYSQMLS